jgi:hypothetical protein
VGARLLAPDRRATPGARRWWPSRPACASTEWRTSPDPTASGSGTKLSLEGIDTNAPTFKSAQQACRRLLPGTPTKQEQAAQLRQALDYADCMRKHGVPKFPDPKLSSGGGIEWGALGPRVGADPNSPQFKAAEDACRELAPR